MKEPTETVGFLSRDGYATAEAAAVNLALSCESWSLRAAGTLSPKVS